MARGRRRNLVERIALGVIVAAVGWVGVNAAAAQLHKASAEELVTPGELTLDLAAGDERVVYLDPDASDDLGFGVSAGEVDCTLALAGDDPGPTGGPGSTPSSASTTTPSTPSTTTPATAPPEDTAEPGAEPTAAELLDVQSTRGGPPRMLDGWSPHEAVVTYTVHTAGTYVLACRGRPLLELGIGGGPEPDVLGLDPGAEGGGVTVHVAEPLPGAIEWAAPQRALGQAFLVVAFAGLAFVVASAFGRSHS